MGVRDAGAGTSHPSISDDGSGNVLIESGKQIIVQGSGPQIVHANGTGTGIDWHSAGAQVGFYVSSSPRFLSGSSANYSYSMMQLNAGNKLVHGISTKAITAVGDSFTALASHIRVSSDGTRTLTSTPTIAAGSDGQILILTYTGANTLTLQDVSALPGSGLLLSGGANLALSDTDTALFVYSSTDTAWLQLSASNN